MARFTLRVPLMIVSSFLFKFVGYHDCRFLLNLLSCFRSLPNAKYFLCPIASYSIEILRLVEYDGETITNIKKSDS